MYINIVQRRKPFLIQVIKFSSKNFRIIKEDLGKCESILSNKVNGKEKPVVNRIYKKGDVLNLTHMIFCYVCLPIIPKLRNRYLLLLLLH